MREHLERVAVVEKEVLEHEEVHAELCVFADLAGDLFRCANCEGQDAFPKIGWTTTSPGPMPSRAAVPPFNSMTARTGSAAAITSSD